MKGGGLGGCPSLGGSKIPPPPPPFIRPLAGGWLGPGQGLNGPGQLVVNTNSGAKRRRKIFGHQKKPPPNTKQMRIFLNPLIALIPKVPLSFFSNFGARGHLSRFVGSDPHMFIGGRSGWVGTKGPYPTPHFVSKQGMVVCVLLVFTMVLWWSVLLDVLHMSHRSWRRLS